MPLELGSPLAWRSSKPVLSTGRHALQPILEALQRAFLAQHHGDYSTLQHVLRPAQVGTQHGVMFFCPVLTGHGVRLPPRPGLSELGAQFLQA